MIWSILICSLESRKDDFLPKILHQLHGQLGHYSEVSEQIGDTTLRCQTFTNFPVEIIIATDDRKISVGAKRNLLTSIAVGKYISFIDDDDVVSPAYCEKILNKINESAGASCIVFDEIRYEGGVMDRQVKKGKEYHRNKSDNKFHYRLPDQKMVWRRDLASKVPFKDISFGEDSEWAKRMTNYNSRQARIDDVLYYYLFDRKTTATQ